VIDKKLKVQAQEALYRHTEHCGPRRVAGTSEAPFQGRAPVCDVVNGTVAVGDQVYRYWIAFKRFAYIYMSISL
jgi:hypothetical protein